MQGESEREVRVGARSGGAAAAALSLWLSLGCGADLPGFDAPRSAAVQLPPIELEGVIFEGYRGELRELSVTAERARIDLTSRVADLDHVKFSFSEKDRGQIEVAAPSGALELDADDFVLSGGVSGSAQEGERFSTEQIRYLAASRRLVSSTPVELQRAELLVRANGMELGLDERRLRLIGQVRAEVSHR